MTGTAAFSIYGASKGRGTQSGAELDARPQGARHPRQRHQPRSREDPGPCRLAGPDAAQQQGLLDYMATQVPIGRVGDPDEIAKAVAFLASDDSSFMAGAELFVAAARPRSEPSRRTGSRPHRHSQSVPTRPRKLISSD